MRKGVIMNMSNSKGRFRGVDLLKSKLVWLCFICIFQLGNLFSQNTTSGEKYGNTLNIGLGLGYYGYVGHSLPVIHLNYEFDVAQNFTLAPFLTFYSYDSDHHWGNLKYTYHQTVLPIGLKGTYYFDQLLNATSKWDFYLGASLGVAIRKTVWEDGYNGETNIDNSSSNLYLDGHIGAEYHVNTKIGLLLDLSSGQSTFCLALHL